MRRVFAFVPAVFLCACAQDPGLLTPPGTAVRIEVPPTQPDRYIVHVNNAQSNGGALGQLFVDAVTAVVNSRTVNGESHSTTLTRLVHGRLDYANLYAVYLLDVQSGLAGVGNPATLVDASGAVLAASDAAQPYDPNTPQPLGLVPAPNAPVAAKPGLILKIDHLQLGYESPGIGAPYEATGFATITVLDGSPHGPITVIASRPDHEYGSFADLAADPHRAADGLRDTAKSLAQETVAKIAVPAKSPAAPGTS